MIGFIFRSLWRLLVGIVSVILAYLTAFILYPYLDDRLPIVVNFFILYIFFAYIVVPLLVRLWHVVIKPTHLPHYTVSGDGWSSDPVNIAIVCKDVNQLRSAMKHAGWHEADKGTLKNNLHLASALIFKRSYPTAPFSKLYMFGRHQDIGFQIQTGTPTSPRSRHHIRFWQLDIGDDAPTSHETFWQDILHLFDRKKRQIWIGAATHDVGPFALRVLNLQITHKIDEQTDDERTYVIDSLDKSGLIKKTEIIPAGKPISFRGQTFGINIVTDGTLHVIQLKE
jgi:hypothetical protein